MAAPKPTIIDVIKALAKALPPLLKARGLPIIEVEVSYEEPERYDAIGSPGRFRLVSSFELPPNLAGSVLKVGTIHQDPGLWSKGRLNATRGALSDMAFAMVDGIVETHAYELGRQYGVGVPNTRRKDAKPETVYKPPDRPPDYRETKEKIDWDLWTNTPIEDSNGEKTLSDYIYRQLRNRNLPVALVIAKLERANATYDLDVVFRRPYTNDDVRIQHSVTSMFTKQTAEIAVEAIAEKGMRGLYSNPVGVTNPEEIGRFMREQAARERKKRENPIFTVNGTPAEPPKPKPTIQSEPDPFTLPPRKMDWDL